VQESDLSFRPRPWRRGHLRPAPDYLPARASDRDETDRGEEKRGLPDATSAPGEVEGDGGAAQGEEAEVEKDGEQDGTVARQEADEGHEVECEQADPEEGDSPPASRRPGRSVALHVRISPPARTARSRNHRRVDLANVAEHPAAVDCPAAAPPSRAGSAVVRHAVGNRPGSWA
jgi:hypothetical protein